MQYFEEKEVIIKKIVCTHPRVAKFWQWGGGAPIPTGALLVHYASILLDNGERKDFELENKPMPELLNQVDEYLKTLD